MNAQDLQYTSNLFNFIASPLQRRNVCIIGFIVAFLSLCVIPYAQRPFMQIGPFLPMFIIAVHITYMLTAYLLFWQFQLSRELPSLILSVTFFYCGCITLPYILTVPLVFTPTGWLGAGPQTAAWLWVFWHLGFPLGLLLYAWSRSVSKGGIEKGKMYYLLPYILYTSVILLVAGLVLLTTHLHDRLPILIDPDERHRLNSSGIGPILLLFNATVFVFVLRLARTKTILHVWLALSALLFLLDIGITLFAGSRYTLGWYASRLNSLFSAAVILSTFVYETNRLYSVLSESEQRYKSLFEQHPDTVYSLDLNGRFVSLNYSCEVLSGYTKEELKQRTPRDFIADEELDRNLSYFNRAKQGIPQNYDTGIIRKDGQLVEVNVIIIPIVVDHKVIGVFGIMRDISDQKRAHRMLRDLSFTDGLTRLANRRYLDSYLEQSWKSGIEHSSPLSIVLFDIDFFKLYNDHYGHQAGDNCLQLVAKTAGESIIHSTDLAARYGGEEFCIVLPNAPLKNTLIVAERIRSNIEKLQVPHAGSKISNTVTVSLGAASMIPTPFSTVDHLIAQADRALYQAKQQGRNQVVAWHPSSQPLS